MECRDFLIPALRALSQMRADYSNLTAKSSHAKYAGWLNP